MTKMLEIAPGFRLSAQNEEDAEPELDMSAGKTHEIDIIRLYFQQIDQYPLLSAEQLTEKFRRLEYCYREIGDDSAEAVRIKDEIIVSNLRLVLGVAKRYKGRGLKFLDLVQEGNIGLMTAVDGFKYRLGNQFSTYAIPRIRKQIREAIAETGRTIRIPPHVRQEMDEFISARDNFFEETGHFPAPAEIANRLKWKPEKISRVMQAMLHVISFETPVQGKDGESPLADFLHDPKTMPQMLMETEENSGQERRAAQLRELISRLPDRQRSVIIMRNNLTGKGGFTFRKIGKALGMTDEGARQSNAAGLKKLTQLASQEPAVA